jgi:hypothetical protein
MAEGLPEFLGGLLLPLANLPTIDEHVVLVGNAVEANGAKRERLEAARGCTAREPLHRSTE